MKGKTMKRILPALVLALLLAAPAAATAKRLTAATVCGSSGCNTASDPATLLPAMEGGPPIGGGPTRARPFYRLVVVVGETPGGERMKLVVLPGTRFVRGPEGTWTRISAAGLGRIMTLADGLRPFPASQLPGLADSSPLAERTGAETPPSSSPTGHTSFPWLAVGAAAVALLLVGGLAINALRSRGHAIWVRTIRGATGPEDTP
jgi:hypothetical protein